MQPGTRCPAHMPGTAQLQSQSLLRAPLTPLPVWWQAGWRTGLDRRRCSGRRPGSVPSGEAAQTGTAHPACQKHRHTGHGRGCVPHPHPHTTRLQDAGHEARVAQVVEASHSQRRRLRRHRQHAIRIWEHCRHRRMVVSATWRRRKVSRWRRWQAQVCRQALSRAVPAWSVLPSCRSSPIR